MPSKLPWLSARLCATGAILLAVSVTPDARGEKDVSAVPAAAPNARAIRLPATPAPARPAAVATARRKPATARASQPAPAAGMRIAIDPETGRAVKPTAEQRAAMSAAGPVADESTPLRIVTLADGTKLHYGATVLHYTIARRDPTGKLHFDCAATLDEARRRLAAPPHSPAPARTPVEE